MPKWRVIISAWVLCQNRAGQEEQAAFSPPFYAPVKKMATPAITSAAIPRTATSASRLLLPRAGIRSAIKLIAPNPALAQNPS